MPSRRILSTQVPLGFTILIAVLGLLQGCAPQYSTKAIQGTVIDNSTGQPLADVNVIAHWVLKYGLEGGNGSDLQLMESVTDDKGRYAFPAWGPLKVQRDLLSDARLKDQDPELIFFKSGFAPLVLRNERSIDFSGPGPSLRTSDWDGRTIALEKFTASPAAYASVVSTLLTGVSIGRCRWQKIPRAIVTITREE